jgi:predicted AlkP superfamily pyrophosphatase or phosphodiesterase
MSIRASTGIVGCLLLAAAGLHAQTPAERPREKKVLVIGIDGCRPDALRAARAPNLEALIREGAFSDRAQTCDRTISGPGWSSMLTGVWRDKHGVRDNKFEGSNYKEYPHFFRRLKQARPGAVTVSLVHWGPINERIVVDADVAKTYPRDDQVAAEAVRVLSGLDPDAVFLHFDDVDGAGHKYGFDPKVAEYVRAVERTDAHLGAVLKALRGRKNHAREDWLILVSTDHGGSGKGHGQDTPEHRTIFLIVSGPSAAKGRIEPAPGVVDVAATALAHLGVTPVRSWKLDGKAVGLSEPRPSGSGKRPPAP